MPIRILKEMLMDRPWMRVAIVFVALLSGAFGVLSPILQKIVIDRLLGYPFQMVLLEGIQNLESSYLVVLAFFCFILSQAFSTLSLWLGSREALRWQATFGNRLYQKVLSLRGDQLEGRTVGEMVSVYAVDTQGATALLDQTLPTGGLVLFPLVLGPIVAKSFFEIPYSVSFSMIGLVFVFNFVLAYRQSGLFLKFKDLASERTGMVSEWVQNIRNLRILGWVASFEQKIFNKRQEETLNRVAMVTNGQLMSSMGSSISFFLNLGAVIYLMNRSQQPVSPGTLMALLWILGIFLARPLRQIPWVLTFALDAWTSLARLSEVLEMKGLNLQADPASVAPSFDRSAVPHASLKIEDLEYRSGSNLLLRVPELEIQPRCFVAVVGEVGSGKTIFLQSLMGETGATFKALRYGETDVLKLPELHRRTLFCVVPQEGFIMSASLRENVGLEYDLPIHFNQSVEQSLGLSQMAPGQENLIDSLDVEIGERGVNLSGGQRQRVSLARAAFFDRPVVLLDDSLSAVDVDTERLLTEQLIQGFWKDRLRILVTHRLSVLPKVDRILFFNDGRITADGTYHELIQKHSSFREFIASLTEGAPS